MKSHEVYKVASEVIYHLNHYDLTPQEVKIILEEISNNLKFSKDRTVVKIDDVDEVKLEDRHELYLKEMVELDARPQKCRYCGYWNECQGKDYCEARSDEIEGDINE